MSHALSVDHIVSLAIKVDDNKIETQEAAILAAYDMREMSVWDRAENYKDAHTNARTGLNNQIANVIEDMFNLQIKV